MTVGLHRVRWVQRADSTVRTVNLMPAPSFEAAGGITDVYDYGTVTHSQSATRAYRGSKSMQITWGTIGAYGVAVYWNVAGLTPGQAHAFSAYVYVPTGAPAVTLDNGGGGGPSSGAVKDQWVRLVYVWTPASATELCAVRNVDATTAGKVCYVDAVQTEKGAATAYFDGDSTGTGDAVYGWTGTPHSSTSYRDVVGAWVDASCEISDATIRHGRTDPTSDVDASSLTLALPTALPAGLDIGTRVDVETRKVDASWSTRFVGNVTDLGTTWELGIDPFTLQPDVVPRGVVTAVGPLARTGRRYVGDVPWPQESDGARAARIFAVLDPAVVGEVDPGTVAILPRDVDRSNALDLLRETAADGGGLLWESRGGLLNYADAEHRRNTTPAVTLDACDVLLAPSWSRTVAGLINDVSLGYGEVPEGGEQPRVASVNAGSQTAFGRYAYSVATQLATATDARERAEMLTVRGGYPAWNINELPLDLAILDDAQTALVLGLDVHSLVQLTGQPNGTPGGAVGSLWVEGWAEQLTYGGHLLTLAVSAYCRTVPAPRWNDVPPSMLWDQAPGTWDDATCLGPLPSLGRWDDVAASLRWDQVPPGTSWDQWKG